MAETQIAEPEFVPDATRVMDRALKAKWIAALRSGEYKQTRQILKSKDGYCCLGVLCEVAGLEISSSGLSVLINGTQYDYGPIYSLGIPDAIGRHLIMMNDGHVPDYPEDDHIVPEGFPAIADYVEATL